MNQRTFFIDDTFVENIPAPRTQFPLPAATTATTTPTTSKPKPVVTASTSPKETNSSNNYIPLLPKATEKRSPDAMHEKSPMAGDDNTSTSSSRKRYDKAILHRCYDTNILK